MAGHLPRLSPGPAIAHSFLDGRTRPNNTQRSSSRSGLPCIRVTRCIEMRLVSGQPDPAVHVGRRICPCASPGPGLDRNHGWRDVLQDQSQCQWVLICSINLSGSSRLIRRSRPRQSLRRSDMQAHRQEGRSGVDRSTLLPGKAAASPPGERDVTSTALRGGPCNIDWRVQRIGLGENAAPRLCVGDLPSGPPT
jgi:hypothetical protein